MRERERSRERYIIIATLQYIIFATQYFCNFFSTIFLLSTESFFTCLHLRLLREKWCCEQKVGR